ncbi:Amino acid permease 2 [Chlorella sorokiniana]|uniref:Amino acid permease 2 n=1 Tax=Chlorella sorokiniana TaxID=3076 RepID=A0A2P6TG41_CHLSO|nr:Amino acid permease 2 [Chlorella sorokiniana]|eukprot:PRW33070.1 Amino acid permease 2 [Chlorella sorokiniana]
MTAAGASVEELRPAGSTEYAPNAKSGTLLTVIAHVFCAIVGAGVLGLPNALAWWGWVAGPLLLVLFYLVSLWTSTMLASVYRVNEIEHARYHHAVQHILGPKWARLAAIFQCIHLVLATLAYTITGGMAMSTAATRMGSGFNKQWQLTLLLGAIEVGLSQTCFFALAPCVCIEQLPSLEECWWVSAIGSVSSLIYCFIALILGCIYAHNGLGSVGGREGNSPTDKALSMLNALGSLAFAYSFAQVLVEIQDTLRQPPPAIGTMRKAVAVGVTGAFGFYLTVACTGYASLGSAVPGEVLDGFTDAPDWPMVLANLAVAAHMITAIQVFQQPLMCTIESYVKARQLRRQQRKAVGGGAVQLGKLSGEHHLPAISESEESDSKKNLDASSQDAAALRASPFADSPSVVAAATEAGNGPAAARVLSATGQLGTADAALSGGVGVLRSHGSVALAPAASGLGSQRLMSVRLTANSGLVYNSAPIPTLLPSEDWKPTGRLARHTADLHLTASGRKQRQVCSTLGSLAHALGRDSMYAVDTGFCNEEVPLNEHGYYVPFWQRFIIRTSYVLLITLCAILMPFFTPVVGLVGSITYWPLCVAFPCLMYAKVYRPSGFQLAAMKAINVFMGFIVVGALIGSARALVVEWSSGFTLFD